MKNEQPLVTIITVVYNGAKYLEQTIKSVIYQGYQPLEYIIIDGGSTDGTHDIINQYRGHIDVFVSEPDKGLYDAMNKGIKLAQGDLIGMINSDDWYEPRAIENIVDAFLRFPDKDIFHADRFDILENGERKIKKYNPSVFKFKYYGMTYNHPSMFITKKEYKRHLYDQRFKIHADYKFVMESFLRNRNIFHYVEKAIVNYRIDGLSSKSNWIDSSKDVYKIRKEVGFTYLEAIFSFILMRVLTSLKS